MRMPMKQCLTIALGLAFGFGLALEGADKTVPVPSVITEASRVCDTCAMSMGAPVSTSACGPGALCLASDRFAVTLSAVDPRTAAAGAGMPIPQTPLFGYFSIPALTGDEGNPEVFVKLIDGREVNGSYWFFYGGLTDLELTLTVTDIETGETRSYSKPGGSYCGGADVNAFAEPCTFALSASSASLGSEGGTGAFTVTTGPACTWTAESDAEWLSVTGGSVAIGSGEVSYLAEPNFSLSSRVGTIRAGGQLLTVSQAGTTVDIAWKRIPAGTFTMGCTKGDYQCHPNEFPPHTVILTRSFDIAETETTNRQYDACVAARSCAPPVYPASPFWYQLDNPVSYVDPKRAEAFCAWVGGRLPTEAEWEYAARGGRNDWRYPWGKGIDHDAANYYGVGGPDCFNLPAPVKSFGPNAYGLYDMAGNVAEWVADLFASYPSGTVTDPQGPPPGTPGSPLLRGGAWYSCDWELRVSSRYVETLPEWFGAYGFRCVRDVEP